ncbi:hypothetical protein DSO57_1038189 [Entomophthora muscae]|uniref:Uncharacterized protein n=2 Tax=Entomophthora muscae TaxID=34485 RepID=A0ACC2U8D7_9FUNG|nr:hypothetical protein DSO57_1020547 [Entomophthora muscae]KAJ9083090.1 hypothetical protein DSO57_1038189 [Entomophthora muscae]
MPAPWFYLGAIVMMAVPVILLVEHITSEQSRYHPIYESFHEDEDEDDINLEATRGAVPPPYQPSDSSLPSSSVASRQPWSSSQQALNSREARLEREEQQAYDEFHRLQLKLRDKQLAEREEKLREYQAKIEEQKELLKKYGEEE